MQHISCISGSIASSEQRNSIWKAVWERRLLDRKERTNKMFETLRMYFQYPFVRYALIVGVLIALCSSLLGVTLVLKRFSFIGDGLSHVAFGAMAIASVLNITNNMLFILPVTVICAILLLRAGQNTRIKGDAAIAMISVGALAIGYLLMNLFSTSPNISGDVCSTLFGSTSILTLTKGEVWLCGILSVVVVAIFILFYNKIFAVTFDENFARATGTRANAYNLLIAVIIVLAMNLVGSLLISALVIFPALSAMRLFKSFRSVTISAAVLSVLSATAGILISILAGTPVGSTIVAVDIAVFLISYGIGRITGR
jgi:zinc transport system permease protein